MDFLLKQDIIYFHIYQKPYTFQFLNHMIDMMSDMGTGKKSKHTHDTENLQCKATKIINCKSKYAKYNIFFNTKIMSVPDIVEPENSLLTE